MSACGACADSRRLVRCNHERCSMEKMKNLQSRVIVLGMSALASGGAMAQTGPSVDSAEALGYVTAAGVATLAVIAGLTVFRAANWAAHQVKRLFRGG